MKKILVLFFSLFLCFDSISTEKDSPKLIDISTLSSDFVLDIRYATTNNFAKEKFYDCPRCFLIEPAAKALCKANSQFKEYGYQIKLFDCYRPLSIQKRMWAKMPNATYLANPYTKGSYHNRGVATDLTIIDKNKNEVDMGTAYDFFGKKACPNYKNLPIKVQKNRALLFKIMKENGFVVSRSEWWHFTYDKLCYLPLLDTPIICD